VPKLPMRFHRLAPKVKCPACGARLTFVQVRGYRDLYQCGSGGPCKCQVMHYRNSATKTCGYAVLHTYGAFGDGEFGVWTACGETAAKEK
jgi:hypothetical protein